MSRTTVSQILNGNVSQFPQETRDRVAAAAAELNYRPSRAGRTLVRGVSDMVVVTFPSITFGPHLQDAVDQITEASASLGMSVVVRFAGRDTTSTLTSVLDLRPTAVIDFGVFSPDQARIIESSGTHVIPPGQDVGQDSEDEVDLFIGRVQVREVVRRGKKRVVFAQLHDSRTAPSGDNRLRGIQEECEASGFPAPIVIHVALEQDSAVEALVSALDATGDDPVAVCAYNDDVAIAVLAAARRLGMDVPSQLGVLGVDHTKIGQLVTPRLTTVDIDLPRMIDGGLTRLTSIRGLGSAAAQQEMAPELEDLIRIVPGDSC